MKTTQAAAPELTLLLVARDAERDIAHTLGMAAAQDLRPECFEILVVVDPATVDSTYESACNFAQAHPQAPKLRVIYGPAPSLAAGWNEGIRQASAPRILRWDVHGRYPPDFLRRSLEVMEESHAEVVGGPCHAALAPDADPFWGPLILAAERSALVQISTFRGDGPPQDVSTLARGLYRREVFERAGLFRCFPFACEDAEAHARMRRAGARFRFDPRIQSSHFVRTRVSSLLRQKWRNGCAVTALALRFPSCRRPAHLTPCLGLAAAVILCSKLPLLGVLATCVYLGAVLTAARRSLHQVRSPPAPVTETLACAGLIVGIHLCYGLAGWWGFYLGFRLPSKR